jgi:hypothetical protein
MALALLVGCTQTQTYSVSVRNNLAGPVTVCLTKAGGPAEAGWESPEELAGPEHPASDERPPGVVVPAGKVAVLPPTPGEFYRDPRAHAVLRVYAGTPRLSAMNAVSRGSADRLDVPLQPGVNRLVVQVSDAGRMEAVPSSEARAVAPATTRP